MLKFFAFVFLAIGLTPVALAEVYGLRIAPFDSQSVAEMELTCLLWNGKGGQSYTTYTPGMSLSLEKPNASIRIKPNLGYENPTFVLEEVGGTKRETINANADPLFKDFSWQTVMAQITDIKATLITRTATFDQNYGNYATVASRQVSYGSSYGSLPTVTRTGYKFEGWYSTSASSGGTQLTASTEFKGTSDVSWYARWTPETYTVTLVLWEGTTNLTSYTYSESASVTLPTPTHPNGLSFGGWYNNGSYAGSPVSTIPAYTMGDVTFYAKWDELTFPVRLFASDTLSVEGESGTCNRAYKLPNYPKNFDRTGYWGDSWNTHSDLTGDSLKVGSTITRSDSAPWYLYAEWQPCTYLLTFTGGDGPETMESIRAVYDVPTNLPACGFTRTSCRFTGWQTRTNNIPVVYSAGAEVMNMTTTRKNPGEGASESNLVDVVFAAQWETNWVSFRLHQDAVSFHAPEGFPMTDGHRVAYAVGRPWGSLPTVDHSNPHYTFGNWYYVQDGQTNTVSATDEVPDGVAELHASWAFDDPLARALDADGKLEFVSKEFTKSLQTGTEWTVDSTTAAFGQSSVVVSVPQAYRDKTVAVALETSVVGPGTLSFAWRMRMERIFGANNDPYDESTNWSLDTAERLMFGVGAEFGIGGQKVNMKKGFKYGLAETKSDILIVTDPDDTTTKPVLWNGGWTNMSVKIDAEAGETNVVRWIHYSQKGFQAWAATGWVDHVVWTPAGSGIVLPKTETSLSADITVPAEWINRYPTLVNQYGPDLSNVLAQETGKKTADGSPMYVWQDYVIGTDPTNLSSRLTASIKMGADGQPIITWLPDLSEATPKRVYIVYGASTLDGTWQPVSDENRAQMRFFKVGVDVEPSAE